MISILVQFAMVPLTLGYIGQSRFGLWMTLNSFVVFLQIADLGLGNALISEISRLNAEKKWKEMARLLRDTYMILIALASMFLVLVLLAIFVWDLMPLLGVAADIPSADFKYALAILASITILLIPLNACQPVWLGLQKGAYNGVALAIGALLNLVAVALVVYEDYGFLSLLVASLSGTVISQFASCVFLLRKVSYQLFGKKLEMPTLAGLRNLAQSGSSFFVIQVCGLMAYNSDVIIISHYLSANAVAEYSVTMRLFSIPSLLLGLMLTGMWPAFSDALALKDFSWIRQTFWKSLKLSILLALVVSGTLGISAAWIVFVWTKGVIVPGSALIVAMALWAVLTAFGGNISTLLNGVGRMRYQVWMTLLFTFVNVSLSIALVQYVGIAGPLWGSIISLSVYYGISLFYINRIFREKDALSAISVSGCGV
jgi:O-antigen/teichoic acid export membrane protein